MPTPHSTDELAQSFRDSRKPVVSPTSTMRRRSTCDAETGRAGRATPPRLWLGHDPGGLCHITIFFLLFFLPAEHERRYAVLST
jgi:hypothetical protein